MARDWRLACLPARMYACDTNAHLITYAAAGAAARGGTCGIPMFWRRSSGSVALAQGISLYTAPVLCALAMPAGHRMLAVRAVMAPDERRWSNGNDDNAALYGMNGPANRLSVSIRRGCSSTWLATASVARCLPLPLPTRFGQRPLLPTTPYNKTSSRLRKPLPQFVLVWTFSAFSTTTTAMQGTYR